MRFLCKMHDGTDMESLERRAVDAGEVLDVSRIRQGVQNDDFARVRRSQPVAHEVGTDEPGSSCYQNVLRFKAHSTSTLNCESSFNINLKLCRQCRAGAFIKARVDWVLRTLNAGRFAGVGYSEVAIGITGTAR